mgnify:CR=1 FL=1
MWVQRCNNWYQYSKRVSSSYWKSISWNCEERTIYWISCRWCEVCAWRWLNPRCWLKFNGIHDCNQSFVLRIFQESFSKNSRACYGCWSHSSFRILAFCDVSTCKAMRVSNLDQVYCWTLHSQCWCSIKYYVWICYRVERLHLGCWRVFNGV